MKIKLLIVATVLVTQSAFSLNIAVRNMSDYSIKVCPIWKTRDLEYTPIEKTGETVFFNCHLYTLRALLVQTSDKKCHMYPFEGKNLKGLGAINIVVGYGNHFESIYVRGNTEAVKSFGKEVNFTGTRSGYSDCS